MQLHGVELRLGSTLVHLFLCHPVREGGKARYVYMEHAQTSSSFGSFCICYHPCTCCHASVCGWGKVRRENRKVRTGEMDKVMNLSNMHDEFWLGFICERLKRARR